MIIERLVEPEKRGPKKQPWRKMKNALFRKTLKGFYLPLADCGGCLENLLVALRDIPIQLVNLPQQADIVFISGVISRGSAGRVKELFNSIPKPHFVIQIGQCMGKLNNKFENPRDNYAISDKVKNVLPVTETIDGCPPSPELIASKLETIVTYLDTTPVISRTLDEKLDKNIFNP
nr:hypothetical protein [Candidatus Sigynarchaeota archaeon]